MQEGGGGDKLKLRGVLRHVPGGGADPLHCRAKGFVGNLLPIHPDALVKALQMGGSIQPHPVSRRLQDAAQIGADRAFPVGARHMDDAQLPVRVAQPVEEPLRLRHGMLGSKARDLIDVRYRLPISVNLLSLQNSASSLPHRAFLSFRVPAALLPFRHLLTRTAPYPAASRKPMAA